MANLELVRLAAGFARDFEGQRGADAVFGLAEDCARNAQRVKANFGW
jgi:hypothetical protein